jgi:hypothetical protein
VPPAVGQVQLEAVRAGQPVGVWVTIIPASRDPVSWPGRRRRQPTRTRLRRQRSWSPTPPSAVATPAVIPAPATLNMAPLDAVDRPTSTRTLPDPRHSVPSGEAVPEPHKYPHPRKRAQRSQIAPGPPPPDYGRRGPAAQRGRRPDDDRAPQAVRPTAHHVGVDGLRRRLFGDPGQPPHPRRRHELPVRHAGRGRPGPARRHHPSRGPGQLAEGVGLGPDRALRRGGPPGLHLARGCAPWGRPPRST